MKRLLLLLIIGVAFWSCEKDDPAAVEAQTTNPQIILASMATSDVTEVVAQVGENTLNVDFGVGFIGGTTHYTTDVDILFQDESYTIIAEEGGDNYVSVGNIDHSFNIPAPSGGIPFGGITSNVEVDVSTIEYSYDIASRPSDLVVLKGSSSPLTVAASLYRALPLVSGDDLVVMLDWDHAGSDLDMWLYTSTGNSVDSSLTWVNGGQEEIVLPASLPDDFYYIVLRAWVNNSPTGEINYQIFSRKPDGALVINDGAFSPSPYWGDYTFVLEIEKTGSTYVITGI